MSPQVWLFAIFLLSASVSDSVGGDPSLAPKGCGCTETHEIEKKPEKKCHYLTTYSVYEFLNAVIRICRSEDRNSQKIMDGCNMKMLPQRVQGAFHKCSTELINFYCGSVWHDLLATDPIVIVEMFDCVNGIIKELTPAEKVKETEYENCIRNIKPGCRGQKYNISNI